MTGRACLFCVPLLACLAGCQGIFGNQGVPDDPLFLDKKPLEAKAELAPPIALVYTPLTPPANPYFADERARAAPLGRPTVPARLTSRPALDDIPEDDE
jgi:hypothetical protein